MAAVMHVLPAFLLAALALATLPGPATALVLREAVAGSRRRVVNAIAGIEAGLFTWVVLSAFGVAALVAASTVAYTVLRAVGAAVLVLLGLQTLWYARRRSGEPAKPPGALPRLTGFRGGMLTNIANPKAAVFAFSFYPQFIPEGSPALPVTVLLGLVHVGVDVAWFSLLAFAVGQVRAVFASSRIRHWIERVVGTMMVGLGLRLALEHGP